MVDKLIDFRKLIHGEWLGQKRSEEDRMVPCVLFLNVKKRAELRP